MKLTLSQRGAKRKENKQMIKAFAIISIICLSIAVLAILVGLVFGIILLARELK
jgi:cell division septal protein FtsQ